MGGVVRKPDYLGDFGVTAGDCGVTGWGFLVTLE